MLGHVPPGGGAAGALHGVGGVSSAARCGPNRGPSSSASAGRNRHDPHRGSESETHYQRARRLFEEYATSLGFSLCFQNFAAELATLPGDYAPPRAAFCWPSAMESTSAASLLRPLGDGAAEMKRLYVAPTRATTASALAGRCCPRRRPRARLRAVRLGHRASLAAAQKAVRGVRFRRDSAITATTRSPVRAYLELRLEVSAT